MRIEISGAHLNVFFFLTKQRFPIPAPKDFLEFLSTRVYRGAYEVSIYPTTTETIPCHPYNVLPCDFSFVRCYNTFLLLELDAT